MSAIDASLKHAQVLILDEDEEMRGLLASQFRPFEYKILHAERFTVALKILQTLDVSLLIANYKIPEILISDFLTRVRVIAPVGTLSVLVLTNPGLEREREQVVAHGADDALPRPFSGNEINARVKALIKKSHPHLEHSGVKPGRLSIAGLVVDTHSHDVFSDGARIKLTPNEFKLLQALLEHPGEILSRDRLIELVQGEGVAVIDRAVDTHVFSLRKKLGEVGSSIETIRGEGYRVGSTPIA